MRQYPKWVSTALCSVAIGLLSSSSCTVHYCYEDCDPCFQSCRCTRNCARSLAPDFEGAHRLERFVLALERHEDGSTTRLLTGIFGLSLDRALGPREHDARDLELFTRNVVAANPRLLGVPSHWELAAIERVNGGIAVTWAGAGGGAEALVFLLDRAGNLLEIAHHAGS